MNTYLISIGPTRVEWDTSGILSLSSDNGTVTILNLIEFYLLPLPYTFSRLSTRWDRFICRSGLRRSTIVEDKAQPQVSGTQR